MDRRGFLFTLPLFAALRPTRVVELPAGVYRAGDTFIRDGGFTVPLNTLNKVTIHEEWTDIEIPWRE